MSDRHTSSMDRAQRWLKDNTKRYAFKKLQKDIIDTGVCVECGSCVDSCPVDALTGDTSSGKYIPTLTGKCISCGICYAMCPRTFSLWRDVAGDFRSVWRARAPREHRGQDGGVVTALLVYMLSEGIVDGAVVACQEESKPWMPKAATLSNIEELKACAGTVYCHAPVVGRMMDSYKRGMNALAVVGTSCDIDAIDKMKKHPAGYFSIDQRRSAFTIGLFCMESFEYPKMKMWLGERGIEIADVTRFAISGGEFRVTLPSGTQTWPIAELSQAASSSCAYCHDLTGVNADISCGNIGSDEGYTTVIVRSIMGEQVFQEALAKGLIEAEMVDEKALTTIQNVARSKRQRYYSLKPEQ